MSYIPDRLTEGYGVNNQAVEELAHLPVWLASYGPVPALDRGVTLWQYSESGVVDGVEGPVDLDLWFTKE